MKLVAQVQRPVDRREALNDERAVSASRSRRLREFELNQRIAARAYPPGFDGDYVATLVGVLCEDQNGRLVVADADWDSFAPFDRARPHHRAAWRRSAGGRGIGFVEVYPYSESGGTGSGGSR